MITSQELAAEAILTERKKYAISVDLPTESLVHLNFDLDPRCLPGEKSPEDGGIVYATEDEVEEYFARPGRLLFYGREVTNLRTCKLCAQLPDCDLA